MFNNSCALVKVQLTPIIRILRVAKLLELVAFVKYGISALQKVLLQFSTRTSIKLLPLSIVNVSTLLRLNALIPVQELRLIVSRGAYDGKVIIPAFVPLVSRDSSSALADKLRFCEKLVKLRIDSVFNTSDGIVSPVFASQDVFVFSPSPSSTLLNLFAPAAVNVVAFVVASGATYSIKLSGVK